jgi:hypothetical protein
MAKCDHCGTTILFGGIHESGYRFCKADCRNKSYTLLTFAAELPPEFVLEQAQEVHRGPCPKCQGPGPVDIHMKHTALSALVVTHWRSTPILCCESCGTKAKLAALASTTLLGWWGFPWGLIFTPVQIVRNLRGLAASINPDAPSPQLVQLVRGDLASRLAHQAHQPRELAA